MTRSILPESWALPLVDETNREFFTSGRLKVQKCAACGIVQHPPEDVCHACGGMQFEYPEASGRGTVWSHTIVRHPVHPALADVVPYAVALVALEDHPHVRIVGNVVNVPPEQVQVGLPVRVTFDAVRDEYGEVLLPQWEAMA
ncbi:MAG TPA: OB-fold domain-containing protein [Dehalococcoidia bacterium]|nr:OB-fold domain-containing protein [Dehalococcoidia bacterium]